MWIAREIVSELHSVAAGFPVVALVGPRQVGKTSLLEKAFPDHHYVSLDVASLAEMAETRPGEFLERYPPPVIVDEAQYAPGLFRHIKAHVDGRRGENGLFLLTGSQNFSLMRSLSDSLAGRAAVIPFLGLSGAEWAACTEVSAGQPWSRFLLRGGYPALWAAPGISRERWYQGYLATYLERDLRNLIRVGSLRDFERFLRACSARCAQTLNMADLGRDVGISATTAREWIGALVASNQILLLEPYHRSLGKRLVKSPKLYFTDTGLAAYLMGLSADAMPEGPLVGALWENHVVGQWLRWRDWHQPAAALWYWRDQGGHEVDLLVEWRGRIAAIECKYKERPDAGDLRGLRRLRTFYAGEPMDAFVACTTEQPFEIVESVTAINGWQAWPLGKT
ncbi:MAG: ATP-binding protein [Rhodocyclaceae bacterium]|nr:ATP-binding protein [Rhodocyclaceae bacterium]